MTEEAYPYTGHRDWQPPFCNYDEENARADIRVLRYRRTMKGLSEPLKNALAKHPVSVSIDATCIFFRFYSSGVFDHPSCGHDLDHSVTATGYG